MLNWHSRKVRSVPTSCGVRYVRLSEMHPRENQMLICSTRAGIDIPGRLTASRTEGDCENLTVTSSGGGGIVILEPVI